MKRKGIIKIKRRRNKLFFLPLNFFLPVLKMPTKNTLKIIILKFLIFLNNF